MCKTSDAFNRQHYGVFKIWTIQSLIRGGQVEHDTVTELTAEDLGLIHMDRRRPQRCTFTPLHAPNLDGCARPHGRP